MSGQMQSVAFTAIHPALGRIDASRADLGCGLEWAGIHRMRPRIPLVCPECGFGVHARVSRRGLRHFAHDPGRPDECQLSNESIERHLLKLELATAIRDAGWHADLEVRAQDGSWRADVMASLAGGQQRWAWEAQLSPITDADLLERTDRYAQEGIEVCWVSPRDSVPWLDVAPAVRVAEPVGQGPWTVADGLAGFDQRRGGWLVQATPLTTFVHWALEGKVFPHQVLRRYRRIDLGVNRQARRSQVWTTDLSARKQREHDEMRTRQEVRKAERERLKQEAEARRPAVEQAEREERERLQKIEQEARRLEEDERHRQRMIKLGQERLARQERERVAEAERVERERREDQALAEREELEQKAARHWWDEVSPEQWQELLGAIAGYSLKHAAVRALPQQQSQVERQHAYGVALYAGAKLYGIARPHPGSLYRLTGGVLIFVRSAHEAERIVIEGKVAADRVVHFGFPDHEQLQLC